MDHGPNTIRPRRALRRLLIATAAAAALLALPGSALAAGATLFGPADGHHFDHLDVAPTVRFDPVKDVVTNWVLLASDREMTKTVRYCRQFFWAAAVAPGTYGCNKWATGADQYGNDTLLALEPGQVYYWQVISGITKNGETGTASDVRAFYVDAKPAEKSIEEISNGINGTVFDDGTYLNLGVAAYVNSGVRVQSLASSRLAPYAFRIRGAHLGTGVDYSRSYVMVKSAAGTRYLKVVKTGTAGVGTVWRLTANERRLKSKRFTYQLFLKSTRNGALVKSAPKVVIIKAAVKKKAPSWTPD
ncbi:MAG: hypothetical protein JWM90_775 [Thermoleophilia bacterium]|nr:hypothetical protein [Thermoleophilia bacterium]